MAKIRFSGPLNLRVSSFLTLNRIAIQTYCRHLIGRKLDKTWNTDIEIGIHFWRYQFTKAMGQSDIAKGRQIFSSLRTDTNDIYDVVRDTDAAARGTWFRPASLLTKATLLYLHGGGYTFNGPVSDRFAAMLAHRIGANLFMPHYRLTPEHPHPAQAEDAISAWRYLTDTVAPKDIVVIGDSAGGHMALMLLQSLRSANLEQPGLCVGLCPWTDIGPRGASLTSNDEFDLVQGWMALKFGDWLDPLKQYGRKALSPINHDFASLAPIYLQAGGREILRDMIIEFANTQLNNGAEVMLDLWEDMPHDFQIYDNMKSSSQQALARVRQAIAFHIDQGEKFGPEEKTIVPLN